MRYLLKLLSCVLVDAHCHVFRTTVSTAASFESNDWNVKTNSGGVGLKHGLCPIFGSQGLDMVAGIVSVARIPSVSSSMGRRTIPGF